MARSHADVLAGYRPYRGCRPAWGTVPNYQRYLGSMSLVSDGLYVDLNLFLLCLLIAGLPVWVIRLHPRLSSVFGPISMTIIGVILLVVLQAGNNAVFDRVFPVAEVVNLPRGFDAR
jgi:hypothetical protein